MKYCKTYVYWQASNTAVHYSFISRGRSPPPDLFPLAGVPPRQTIFFFCDSRVFLMKKWLATAKPDNRGESLRALQEVSKERITSVANQYFTKLWGVGGSQGRGAPSIEYRGRQKAKESCVKTFVEKYDTVTTPSGEGQAVRKEMTVQVEQWWNSRYDIKVDMLI